MTKDPDRHSPNWGGKRPGAGAKKKLVDGVKKIFVIERHHIAILDQWSKTKGYSNLSEALRALIEDLE